MDKLQKITLVGASLMCAAVITIAGLTRPKQEQATDTTPATPAFDAEAVSGTPDITDESICYSSLELPLKEGSCKLSLAAAPKLNGSELDVYFTNSAESTVGLKLVIFDDSNNVIGESGIIKNGEYVKSVELDGKAARGQQLNAKILTYEADTYFSLGSAGATLLAS